MTKTTIISIILLALIGFGLWWAISIKEEINFKYIPTSADNAPPGSIHNLPVPIAVSAVRTLVARELNISEGVVIIMTAYEKEWPDGCLGLSKAGEFCTQALVSGYEVTVQANGKERVYRTNANGSVIRQVK